MRCLDEGAMLFDELSVFYLRSAAFVIHSVILLGFLSHLGHLPAKWIISKNRKTAASGIPWVLRGAGARWRSLLFWTSSLSGASCLSAIFRLLSVGGSAGAQINVGIFSGLRGLLISVLFPAGACLAGHRWERSPAPAVSHIRRVLGCPQKHLRDICLAISAEHLLHYGPCTPWWPGPENEGSLQCKPSSFLRVTSLSWRFPE